MRNRSRFAFIYKISILLVLIQPCMAQVRPIIDNGFLGMQFWATGIHPSGQFVVKADRSVIHAHDRRNKMLFQTYQAPCIVNTIGFSPDGKWMFVNTMGEINEECNRVLVYNFYTGEVLYNEKGMYIETAGKSPVFYIKKREPATEQEYLELHRYTDPGKIFERRFYPQIDTTVTMLRGHKGGYKEFKGSYTPQDLQNGRYADSLPKQWKTAEVKQDPLKYIRFDYQTEQETDSVVIGELDLSLIVDSFGFVDKEDHVLVYGMQSGRFIDSIPSQFFGYSYQEKTGKVYFPNRNGLVYFDLSTAKTQQQKTGILYNHYCLVENDSSFYEVSVYEEKIQIRKQIGMTNPTYTYFEIPHPYKHYELFNNGRYYGTVLASQKIIIHNKNKIIDLNTLTLEHVSTSPDTTLLHPAIAGIQPDNANILKINGWTWDMHNARQFFKEEIPQEKKLPFDAGFESSKLFVMPDDQQKVWFNIMFPPYDMENISYPFEGKDDIFSEAKPLLGGTSIDVYKDDTSYYLVNLADKEPMSLCVQAPNKKKITAEEKKFREYARKYFSQDRLTSLNTFPGYTLFPFITNNKFPLYRTVDYNKKIHDNWFYAPVFKGDETGYTANKQEAENMMVYNLFRPSLSYDAVTGKTWYNMNIINRDYIPQLDYAGIIPENDIYYSDFTFPVNENQLLSMNYAYGVFALKKTDGSVIVQSSLYSNGEFIHVTPDGYYFASRNKLNRISLRKDNTVYPIEQFDLKYNRPDIVLQRLGCTDQALLDSYRKAYLKRLKKLGFTEAMLKEDFHLPTLSIKNLSNLSPETDSTSMSIDLAMNDSRYHLDRIQVWINDVPVYGSAGISVRDQNTSQLETSLRVDLCSGENKMAVSVLNQAGAESYKAYLTVNCKAIDTKPELYLVTIGDSKYTDNRYDLSFAAKDARDIADVLSQNATGIYARVHSHTLTDENVTREKVEQLKEVLAKAKRNDVVIVTMAGHGVLDKEFNYYLATHDMDFNDPAQKGLPYEDLESLLDGIAPLRKTILIDACHSGEVDKEEVEQLAVHTGENSDIKFRAAGAGIRQKNLGLKTTSELMKELFTDLRTGTGATVISSASGVEYAMESPEWNNGLFTYCLLYGIKSMKADLDANGEIWLSEIQQYLNKTVSELSKGRQKPTTRMENLSMDFRIW